MTDIVKRLRAIDHLSIEDCFLQSPLFGNAADEIERLREANEMMLTDIRRTDVDMLAFKAEIERLRAALRDVLSYVPRGNMPVTIYDNARAVLEGK